jgi:hypothetical protein
MAQSPIKHKKKRRWLISLALLVFVFLATLTLFLTPERATADDQFLWEHTGDSWSVKKYLGSDRDVVIPSQRTAQISVQSWLGGRFSRWTGIQSIPRSQPVTSIGDAAFDKNEILQFVTVPESVTVIESSAFRRCSSLKSIKIPSAVARIKNDTFVYCARLEIVDLPEGLTFIDEKAFYGCSSLASITLPSSLSAASHTLAPRPRTEVSRSATKRCVIGGTGLVPCSRRNSGASGWIACAVANSGAGTSTRCL